MVTPNAILNVHEWVNAAQLLDGAVDLLWAFSQGGDMDNSNHCSASHLFSCFAYVVYLPLTKFGVWTNIPKETSP